MSERSYIPLLILAAAVGCTSCGPADEPPEDLSDEEIVARAIDEQNIVPLPDPPAQAPAKVELGRALFFDKELSGNRDTSCASCHHPTKMTSDEMALGAGTGAVVDGPERRLGEGREPIPRNAIDVFNRGVTAWTTMFWDNRIRVTDAGHMLTPAGSRLPDGLDNVLAAQAMFPVTSRDEMRGERWDDDVNGQPNELGDIVDSLLNQIWVAVMDRLLAIDGYRELFAAAYPATPPEALGFEHAANALAAFQIEAFSFTDSPWDRYVAGETDALSDQQLRGAALFFGEAGCGDCHSGTLLTDQKPHNIAVPQFGPGKDPDEPLDLGFGRVSNDPRFNFAFRTPSLRNVALTAPYMHNGAYETLEGAIRHHLTPIDSLYNYDAGHLDADLREQLHDSPGTLQQILETLDPAMATPPELSDAQIDDLLAFMDALTAKGADDTEHVTPASVPSGLPVD